MNSGANRKWLKRLFFGIKIIESRFNYNFDLLHKLDPVFNSCLTIDSDLGFSDEELLRIALPHIYWGMLRLFKNTLPIKRYTSLHKETYNMLKKIGLKYGEAFRFIQSCRIWADYREKFDSAVFPEINLDLFLERLEYYLNLLLRYITEKTST